MSVTIIWLDLCLYIYIYSFYTHLYTLYILVMIIFQEFRPILPFTPRHRRVTPTSTPEKLTMKLWKPFFFTMFCTQTKNNQKSWDHPFNGIIRFHPIGHHPIGRHPMDVIQFQTNQSPKSHLRDEFVVKKQVVSTPSKSRQKKICSWELLKGLPGLLWK